MSTNKKRMVKGMYYDVGVIRLESGELTSWPAWLGGEPPRLPFGTLLQFTVEFEHHEFLQGIGGVVWATYDPAQAQTIQDALRVQNIQSRLESTRLGSEQLVLVRVQRTDRVEQAIDFLRRHDGGMRLQPDWYYPRSASNTSFRKWTEES